MILAFGMNEVLTIKKNSHICDCLFLVHRHEGSLNYNKKGKLALINRTQSVQYLD